MGAVGADGARPRRAEIDAGKFSSLRIAVRRSDKDNGRRQEFGPPDRRVEVCWPVGIADERTTPSDGRLPPWRILPGWRLRRYAQALADSLHGIRDCASRIPRRVLRDRVPSRRRPRSASANPLFLACVTFPLPRPCKADWGHHSGGGVVSLVLGDRMRDARRRGHSVRQFGALWRFSCQNSVIIVGADAGDCGSPPASSSAPARDDCHGRCGRVRVRDLDPGRR